MSAAAATAAAAAAAAVAARTWWKACRSCARAWGAPLPETAAPSLPVNQLMCVCWCIAGGPPRAIVTEEKQQAAPGHAFRLVLPALTTLYCSVPPSSPG